MNFGAVLISSWVEARVVTFSDDDESQLQFLTFVWANAEIGEGGSDISDLLLLALDELSECLLAEAQQVQIQVNVRFTDAIAIEHHVFGQCLATMVGLPRFQALSDHAAHVLDFLRSGSAGARTHSRFTYLLSASLQTHRSWVVHEVAVDTANNTCNTGPARVFIPGGMRHVLFQYQCQ